MPIGEWAIFFRERVPCLSAHDDEILMPWFCGGGELFKMSHVFGEMPRELVVFSYSLILIVSDDE